MRLKTSQFGEIEFDENLIINFPEGIIGFEYLKKFIIIDDEDTRPFRWLVSVEEPEIGFALLELAFVVENCDERFELDPSRYVLFGIVTLSKDISRVTINLKAPVLIDKVKNEGRQIIVDSEEYPIAHPLVAE